MPKLLFAGTIFSSAFLLFLVQPLISKQILPWFGGSAAVWATCMVFFQVTLLAGYAYADWLSRRPSARQQALIHVALLALSLVFLPVVANATWKPAGNEDPALRILGLLIATVGLPYLMLSTTGPLIQSWVSRTLNDTRVYRFFSLSNLASLVALMSYPFVLEPRAPLLLQAQGWSVVYAVFVVLCSACAVYFLRHGAVVRAPDTTDPPTVEPPRPLDQWLWLALSAMGSWLLVAVTNHITQNIAAIPFLWLLPLTLYLLTFVLAFESDRWYTRARFLPLTAVALAVCAYGLTDGLPDDLRITIPTYTVGMFIVCLFLHGELARMRPVPRYLTRFYLMLSLGGALGGIAVGLVAPRVLTSYYELGAGYVITALLAARVLRERRAWRLGALGLATACAVFLAIQVHDDRQDARLMARNFYGTLQSLDAHRDDPRNDVRQLYHGSVKHGEQYLLASRSAEPTTYYGPTSGIGRAILARNGAARKIGLIGLGAGTLAAYGRDGDTYRFYEINPQVIDFAQREFSFMRDSKARIETVLGDARLSLEKEAPQDFDILAVDAFSGDSVPVHLITREAIAVYLRHVKPDGIIAFHVTNRFLQLPPVVEQIAAASGLHVALIHDDAKDSELRATDWVLVARDAATLSAQVPGRAADPIVPIPGLRLWSDDFNNLFQVLK
jgi:SAM-dependent methyltransferase